MILCVTLNPCLDKTLTVPAWRPGDSVRGTAVHAVVGGKGNNVARALRRLGRSARPVTFLGGPIGTLCEERLRTDDGLEAIVVRTTAETRVILTVRTDSSADQTAFFDPDPAIAETESEALFRAVEEALAVGECQALTLSGSSPSPATHGLYSELIALGRSRRVPVFLDTYGPALEAIWGFWPQAMQLNRREAGLHLGKPNPTEDDLMGLLERWARHGVQCGVVTDGANPALARVKGTIYRVVPPEISAVNPIGSGDCLLAGLVDGWISGLAPEPLVRRAFGSAVANALVWDAGGIDPDEVERQSGSIVVETIRG
ncbi:MAG: PfkB family carbohydrate kinase [Isosphaeraceae bacterium]